MGAISITTFSVVFVVLTFVAWRRYLWAAEKGPRGQAKFRDLPTLDVLTLPEKTPRRLPPAWLDDPTQRLARISYTSGTTGMPKGVECPHAGYVNLALSYADYFDLIPGMDATSLTSSLGYDDSISEMYSAWVSGCAVVMLTKEQMRSGPDLVPVLRIAVDTVQAGSGDTVLLLDEGNGAR